MIDEEEILIQVQALQVQALQVQALTLADSVVDQALVGGVRIHGRK